MGLSRLKVRAAKTRVLAERHIANPALLLHILHDLKTNGVEPIYTSMLDDYPGVRND